MLLGGCWYPFGQSQASCIPVFMLSLANQLLAVAYHTDTGVVSIFSLTLGKKVNISINVELGPLSYHLKEQRPYKPNYLFY